MKTQYEMVRLRAMCDEKGPLCVGLDTAPSYIPPEVLKLYNSPADAVLAYNRALVSGTAPSAACFKVQIAYYEAMGLAGLGAYAETLKSVRSAGIPVIADIKRGDIANTAEAYARAHFTGDFEADIITLNPYMGFDTLEPFLTYAEKSGKGAFVLLRTSNPGMKDIEWRELAQDSGIATNADSCPAGTCFPVAMRAEECLDFAKKSRRVLDAVGAGLKSIARRFPEAVAAGCSPFGAVVGCTEEAEAREIRDQYPDLFFLIPGYGAQGGAARTAATLLGRTGGTVNSSRGILTAWKKDPSLAERMNAGVLTLDDIVGAAVCAAGNAKNDLLSAKKQLATDGASKGTN